MAPAVVGVGGRVAQRHRPAHGRGGYVRVAGDGEHAGVGQDYRFPQTHLAPPLKPEPTSTVTAEWVSWASISVPIMPEAATLSA